MSGLPEIRGTARAKADRESVKKKVGDQDQKSKKVAVGKAPRSPKRLEGSRPEKRSTKHISHRTEQIGELALNKQLETLAAVPPIRDKKAFLTDLLISGFVNSYVELFFLTHRDTDDGKVSSTPLPIQDLEFIKDQLAESESAHRQGDSGLMYAAYKQIANYYSSRSDKTTSVYFNEKCLEIALVMNDLKREAESNHDLGVLFDQLNDLEAAIRFHERHLEVARQIHDNTGMQLAGSNLTQMFLREATRFQESQDVAHAIESLSRGLDAAITADDRKSEGLANHRLGIAYSEQGDTATSIQYFLNFLRICVETQDRVAECEAEASLGKSYRSMNRIDEAILHLRKYLNIAIEIGSKDSQEKACAELGVMYTEAGQFDKAVEYFDRNFHLARDQGQLGALDKARISFGIAHGNMQFNEYMRAVMTDLDQVLRWQSERVPFWKM